MTPCSSIMRGLVNYRWKKSYPPHNIYFFWVARLQDLAYFKWLLIGTESTPSLRELKIAELAHNEFYAGDTGRADAITKRMEEIKKMKVRVYRTAQHSNSTLPTLLTAHSCPSDSLQAKDGKDKKDD